jgi:hypothetical protein
VTGDELLLGRGDVEAQRLTAGWRAGSPRCWDNGALRELRRMWKKSGLLREKR